MSVLLFTGHRLDAADRTGARFTAKMVPGALAQIAAAFAAEQETAPVHAAVSSLAAGADLLFAELVLAADVPLYAFLPVPEAEFLVESVAYPTASDDGTDWLARYRAAAAGAAAVYLAPAPLDNPTADVFATCNARMLAFAQQLGAAHRVPVRAISYFSALPHHIGQAGGAADFTRHMRAAGISVRHLVPKAA